MGWTVVSSFHDNQFGLMYVYMVNRMKVSREEILVDIEKNMFTEKNKFTSVHAL